MSTVKIIVTEDGSHSLYHPGLNETYHSFHGAVRESNHVFIKEGLDYYWLNHQPPTINVLEVGFGTGLNAILTSVWAAKNQIKVNFTTLEPFPLKEEVFSSLNYHQFIEGEGIRDNFLELHNSNWETDFQQHSFFTIHKSKSRLQDFSSNLHFDLIFYDAFAPSKQSEMWTSELLEKTIGVMAAQGVFVTYCAKGQFKRDLTSHKLIVETLPGPPGKKEMVRGVKA